MEVGFANPSEESQQHIHATLFSHHGQNLGEQFGEDSPPFGDPHDTVKHRQALKNYC